MDTVVYESADLLVVNKPPGWNTHAPSPYAGEGIYEWFRHRDRRWADLAIHQRLDKETSGLMVFAKTRRGNESLARQFEARTVEKRYVAVTSRAPEWSELTVRSNLVRVGDRYETTPDPRRGTPAETRFRVERRDGERAWLEAEPVTGRTHQIRAHAASRGVPILGDSLYGGAAAGRLHLHSRRLRLRSPEDDRLLEFTVEPRFDTAPRVAIREAVIDASATTAFRVWNGLADGGDEIVLDRWGEHFVAQAPRMPGPEVWSRVVQAAESQAIRGVYFRALLETPRGRGPQELAPRPVWGEPAPDQFAVLENGMKFQIRLGEGYSVGLFLDQRDNRRSMLERWTGAQTRGWGEPGEGGWTLLNLFAYTCGFSVCAARAGGRTTSVDLSVRALEWGRQNFAGNQISTDGHEFMRAEAFDAMRRLRKRGARFDVVVLDPPTFSQSKEAGVFRAERDYGRLVADAAPLIAPGGMLLACTNASKFEPEAFVETVTRALEAGGREVAASQFRPAPPDFPASRAQPAFFKSMWVRLAGARGE